MSHKCPASGCPARVADHMLMCRPHWYMVPSAVRLSVWETWQDGAGSGSVGHNVAMRAAIDAVNAKLEAKAAGGGGLHG